MADLIVKSVFATLPKHHRPTGSMPCPAHLTPQAKITQQLRFIFIGLKHWQGLGQHRVSRSTRRMETLGSGVVLVPVAVAQRIDTHGLAGARRMNEFALAYIETHMADLAAPITLEEHRIAGLERTAPGW